MEKTSLELNLKEIELLLEGLSTIETSLMSNAFSKSLLTMMFSNDENKEERGKKAEEIIEKEGRLDIIKKNQVEILKARITLLKTNLVEEILKDLTNELTRK